MMMKPQLSTDTCNDDSLSVKSYDADDPHALDETGTEIGQNDDAVDEAEKQRKEHEQEVKDLLKKETRSVITWRVTVSILLVVTGVLACTATYVIFEAQDDVEFENAFQEAAHLMEDAYVFNAERVVHSAESLADYFTATAHDNNDSWPFVDIPSFEIYGRYAREQSDSEMTLFAPYVSEANKEKWSEFALANKGWIDRSNELAKHGDHRGGPEGHHQGHHEEESHKEEESDHDEHLDHEAESHHAEEETEGAHHDSEESHQSHHPEGEEEEGHHESEHAQTNESHHPDWEETGEVHGSSEHLEHGEEEEESHGEAEVGHGNTEHGEHGSEHTQAHEAHHQESAEAGDGHGSPEGSEHGETEEEPHGEEEGGHVDTEHDEHADTEGFDSHTEEHHHSLRHLQAEEVDHDLHDEHEEGHAGHDQEAHDESKEGEHGQGGDHGDSHGDEAKENPHEEDHAEPEGHPEEMEGSHMGQGVAEHGETPGAHAGHGDVGGQEDAHSGHAEEDPHANHGQQGAHAGHGDVEGQGDAHSGHAEEDPHANHGQQEAQQEDGDGHAENHHHHHDMEHGIVPYIQRFDFTGYLTEPDPGPGPYAPIWEMSPPPLDNGIVNLNLFSAKDFVDAFADMHGILKGTVLSKAINPDSVFCTAIDLESTLGIEDESEAPHSMAVAQVLDTLAEEDEAKPVGLVVLLFAWGRFLDYILPSDIRGLYTVVENSCGQTYSFFVDDGRASYLGEGFLQESDFTDMAIVITAEQFYSDDGNAGCSYSLHVYPSEQLKEDSASNAKYYATAAVAVVFFLVLMAFLYYDRTNQVRNNKVIQSAVKSNLIVSEIYPSTVRKRLFAENDKQKSVRGWKNPEAGPQKEEDNLPVADFYPSATLLFADLAGFTAWCSDREPAAVFKLLETIYGAFDSIAARRKVFKVETIGDCYVAATGLPKADPKHCLTMCRFAWECLNKMNALTAELEVTLGPGTADLKLRCGIHSGPVTAGVVKGTRARFQLFGDTVNTCARIETTGQKDRIHLSEQAANILTEMGKGNWLVPRPDKVVAKGKGALTTYWLELTSGAGYTATNASTVSNASSNGSDLLSDQRSSLPSNLLDPATARLVAWAVDTLQHQLERMAERRQSSATSEQAVILNSSELDVCKQSRQGEPSTAVGQDVVAQIHDYVSEIAGSYQKASFHGWQHACHVCMSVVKLLGRIGVKSAEDNGCGKASDPLTHFACVFSALIHNVNVADRTSADFALNLLMESRFREFRAAMCSTDGEMTRFRQLVGDCVKATDLAEHTVQKFLGGDVLPDQLTSTDAIDHLMQAAAIAHYMQPWSIFLKWDEKLFLEIRNAVRNGSGETDPAERWVSGDMKLFDFYVIPLAKKLHESDIFTGSSCDDLIGNATANREQWGQTGDEVVQGYLKAEQASEFSANSSQTPEDMDIEC